MFNNRQSIIPDYGISAGEIRKNIFHFAWPIVLETMLMTLLSVVNTVMVGHLGAASLSAVGLTNQPVFISIAVFQSINIGATALISRFIGAGNRADAKITVIQTLMMSVFLGIALFVLGFMFSRQIVTFMGANKDTLLFAEMYMKYMAAGMLFQSIPTAISSIFRGAGDSRSPMHYNIVSNVVNALLGYTLIYGPGFFPELGLQGAAIANTAAKFTACLMSVIAIFNPKFSLNVTLKDKFRLDFSMLKRIMNIGVSAAVEQFVMRIGFLVYTTLLASLGTVTFAAHQIVSNVTQILSNFVVALGIAASSLTGRSLGAENPLLAEKYCHEISNFGFIVSLANGLVFFFFGYQVSQIYSSDENVLKVSADILKVAALISIPQNSLNILSGGLRGAGDTKWTMISSLVGIICSRIILAYIFIKFLNYGAIGAWTAALIDQSIRSILVYLRFRTGRWKLKKV